MIIIIISALIFYQIHVIQNKSLNVIKNAYYLY